MKTDLKIKKFIDEARVIGWIVEMNEWCEDAETPGFIGQVAGVCIHDRKSIKIRTHGRTQKQIAFALEHEIQHARGMDRIQDNPSTGLRCGGTVKHTHNAALSRREEIAVTIVTREHSAVGANNQILIIIFLKCFFLCLERTF
jgi:hypothetical protein